jgi:branched-chain amino acid transport system substrate-binding protein
MSTWDIPNTRTLEMAVDDINAQGGVDGHPLKVIEGDMKTDTSLAGQVALELIDKGAQILMISCDYDNGAPSANAAATRKVVAISSCGGSTKFDSGGAGPYGFSMAFSGAEQGYAAAEFAFNKMGWKTAYMLTDQSIDYHKKTSAGFEERFVQLAGNDSILGKDTFMNDDPSIAAQITRIEALKEKPDVILMDTHAPGGAGAIRQLRAAGINTPLLAFEGLDGDFWLNAVPNLSDLYTFNYASIWGDDPRPEVVSLMERYKEKYGEAPLQGNLVTGYSVGQVIAKAIEMAGGKTDGDSILKALESFNSVPTISGPVTFTASQHMSQGRPEYVNKTVNGRRSFDTVMNLQKLPDLSEAQYQ